MKFSKCITAFCVGVGSEGRAERLFEVLRQTRELPGSIPCRVLRKISSYLFFVSAFTTVGVYSLAKGMGAKEFL